MKFISLACLAAGSVAACGGASIRWAERPGPNRSDVRPPLVYVLKATGPRRVEIVNGVARPVVGVGGQWSADEITRRVAEIVRERYPAAQVLDTLSVENGAAMAAASGATHVLVTTVLDWREGSRIDGEGDRVRLTLELTRVERVAAPSVAPGGPEPARLAPMAAIDVRAHGSGVAAAFSTSDRPAMRLLDSRLRRAVLELLSALR